jgi:hypothetical protein
MSALMYSGFPRGSGTEIPRSSHAALKSTSLPPAMSFQLIREAGSPINGCVGFLLGQLTFSDPNDYPAVWDCSDVLDGKMHQMIVC